MNQKPKQPQAQSKPKAVAPKPAATDEKPGAKKPEAKKSTNPARDEN